MYYITEALQQINKAGDYFVDMSDTELARLTSKGRQDAFCELIRRYGALVKAIAAYHLRDFPMWRDDCVNDVFFSIWQNIDRFDPNKSTFKNWIGASAKYCAINYKRKHYRELESRELDDNIADERNVEAELIRRETEAELISLLSGLSPQDREIFIKRYIRDMSVEDIARGEGEQPSWVYNRLSRGRRKLKRLYGGKWSDYCEKRI